MHDSPVLNGWRVVTGMDFNFNLHVKLMGVSLVAAGLALVGPADAGVILKKSETRKVKDH